MPRLLEVAENVRPDDLKRVMMTREGAVRRVDRDGAIFKRRDLLALGRKEHTFSLLIPTAWGSGCLGPKEAMAEKRGCGFVA